MRILFKLSMMLYRLLSGIFFGLGGVKILSRNHKQNINERTGHLENLNINPGCVWVHAVSVGEVQSAGALIREIKTKNNLPCIISTVTATGHETALKLLNGLVDKVIYSVWDNKKFVTRTLNNIQPAIYITMETELWPELLTQLHSRKIPVYLANGRISEKSFKRLKKMSWFWKNILACFNLLMVRFEDDREKFLTLGMPDDKIIITGDCKVDTLLNRRDDVNSSEWQWLKSEDTKLFVAGSTHQGEDDIIISAFRMVRKKFPNSKLVIVPRHPERALMSIASVLPFADLQAELLSKLPKKPDAKNFDVLVVDKIGVLFNLYSIADAVFVGGSLVIKGGQNPFEPALFGVRAIHGPCMTDFPDTERMDAMGAALCVHNDFELARAWCEALQPGEREKSETACKKYFETLGGAAKKTWQAIAEDLKL